MKTKFLVLIIFAVCTAYFAAAGTNTKNSSASDSVPKVNVKLPFTKGLNLSNWLEPFGYGNSASYYFGKQDFEDIKSLGVEVVRIPIHFEAWNKGKPDYVVEDWLWEKLDNAVAWCTELKMYIIIDFHNDCNGSSKTNPDIEKILLKIWPQIAERYKNSGEYVIYEIMNEPHFSSGNLSSDIAKWNKIQGNVLKAIRAIDTKHTVIVGGADWDSLDTMLKLPDYKDDNLIYNFHDYTPFLFTHQGASWTHTKRLMKIPFPYVKEKMPPRPANLTSQEKAELDNYPKAASGDTLVAPLNKAVEFANSRNVALMCNEYGVLMDFADNTERTNWYRLKAKWMEERNIIRVSWDYRNSFGIFTNSSMSPLKARFPEDLNTELIEGMGFKIPAQKTRARKTWLDVAKQKGDFTIYKNGFADKIFLEGWMNDSDPIHKNIKLVKKDSEKENSYIYIPSADAWNGIKINFGGTCDMSQLVSQNATLEFEVKTKQKGLNLRVYFNDEQVLVAGENGYPWRCATDVTNSQVPADGQWHKISIPLKSMWTYGTNVEEKPGVYKWYNDTKKLFSWQKVEALTFEFSDKPLTEEICIRDIRIK